MKEKYSSNIRCVFCGYDKFELPSEDYTPEEGEMIKCGNCGKMNDFSSLKNVLINDTKKEIMHDFQDEIKKIFKKSGFKIK